MVDDGGRLHGTGGINSFGSRGIKKDARAFDPAQIRSAYSANANSALASLRKYMIASWVTP